MSSIKIGIIGAGSAVFSLRLISDVCKTPSLKGTRIALMDVDKPRLDAITVLARRFADEMGAQITFEQTTDLADVIKDSRFVINTALVGGHDFLENMRTIGEKHGYYRGIDAQEFNLVSDYYTLTNWNQLSFFLTIAETIEKTNRHAWLLQSANPVFEGTTLIQRETPINMVGLCHGYHDVDEIAEAVGTGIDEIDWQVAGVNHGIWLNRFRYQGSDLYPRLQAYFENRQEWSPQNPFDIQLAPAAEDMFRFYTVFPVGDTVRNTTWKYHYDLETKKKWYGQQWGGVDSELGWQWYRNKLDDITSTIQHVVQQVEEYPGTSMKDIVVQGSDTFPQEIKEDLDVLYDPERMSGEQHIPFIDAIENGNVGRLVVNTLNQGGIIKGLDEDVAVEYPALVDREGIHPETIDPQLPERVVKWYLRPRVYRMDWALEAFLRKDPSLILELLIRDRRTKSFEQAQAVVEELFGV
jgi:alpha-galactosidase